MADENAGIRETLRALIVKESFVDESKLVEDATLESLSIDSLDMSMIMMAIEEKFDIYLSVDTELDGIVTFGELVALLEKKVSQGIAEQPAK
ncbi:MAG: phosphopantetheine-binding protein [Nitratireductor sp.]